MLRGWVATTDYDWYRFLSGQPQLDEVNFWQPSVGRPIKSIGQYDPFFFKLKSPRNAIAGFGLYVGRVVLPAWRAWESFKIANGAPSFTMMRERIEKLRHHVGVDLHGNYLIGCLMIAQPLFFNQEEWVPQPRDWKPNVQQGATYDLTSGEGLRLWQACRERALASVVHPASGLVLPASDRFGKALLIRPRLGQGTFRSCVEEAYDHACAITTEHSLPVLEAAHIHRYADGGEHAVSNGILLRADIHRLFDKGYVTVTSDHKFEVSRRLKEDYENGKTYYELRGQPIYLPRTLKDRPDPQLLDWHNTNQFLQ